MYALVEPLHVYLLNGPAVLQGLTCVLILPRGKIYDSPFERRNFFLLPRGRKQVHRARKRISAINDKKLSIVALLTIMHGEKR